MRPPTRPEASYTVAAIPWSASSSAQVSPAIPAPTMTTVGSSPAARTGRGDRERDRAGGGADEQVAAGETARRGAPGCALFAQPGERQPDGAGGTILAKQAPQGPGEWRPRHEQFQPWPDGARTSPRMSRWQLASPPSM